jgi:hypothetical protein
MRRTAIFVPLVAIVAVGCGKKTTSFHNCANDSQCAPTQVCFPDGCGDLAQGLRVEIIPNPREGLYAQDFVVGTLANKQDFTLAGASTIEGALQQLIDDQGATPYPGSVSIHALGESSLIPGVIRSFELGAARGAYVLPVATGTYSVVANATEELLPPIQLGNRVIVASGTAARADVLFPSSNSLSQLSGQLFIGGQPPPADLAMFVQAFAPNTQRPLSQRVSVDSMGCTPPCAPGQFQLPLPPAVSSLVVQAFPVNSDAVVPRRGFPIALPSGSVVLELGAFGSSVRVAGTLLTSAGEPLSGATVYLEGEVIGGATFRTRSAISSSNGSFTLTALRSAVDRPETLWAFPPPESACAIVSVPARVTGPGNFGAILCQQKVQVHGLVHLANGLNAVGVQVTAQPVSGTPGYPLPSNLVRGVTDSVGMYTLYLDPAVYRLDFIPHGMLPRLSRFVTIAGELGDSGFMPVEIESVSLSNSRRLTGILSFAAGAGTSGPVAALASIRFFRLSTDSSAPASVLLAETVSDQTGKYSVILPAR